MCSGVDESYASSLIARRYLDIKKNRFDGELGTVPFVFDKTTMKIYELSADEQRDAQSKFDQVNPSYGRSAVGGGSGMTWKRKGVS